MHGAGNDFVVLDCTREPFSLTPQQLRFLADRHFGIGADQILVVEPAEAGEADFKYRIFNADGGEVEQCGNGARCFVKFVYNKGLTEKKRIRAKTMQSTCFQRRCIPLAQRGRNGTCFHGHTFLRALLTAL